MIELDKIYSILKTEVQQYKTPVVDLIEIQTKNPFKVLVSTIISARTKDKTTLEASERLFKNVSKVQDLNKLSLADIEALIYPVGFYRQKAKYLKQLPEKIKEFNDQVPDSIEELIKLPGVGRKTANLVLAVAFKKPAICVDTHVHRIMNRLAYVKTKTPFETEMILRKKMPKKYWLDINSILVAFGQSICTPLSPWCSRCPIEKYCTKINVKKWR